MDEELKTIQADLDSVLDRLAEHMSRDTLASEADDPQPTGREDAARVALHYAKAKGSLESSVRVAQDVPRGRWPGPKSPPESRLGEPADPNTNAGLADLLAALRALWEWQWHRFPLEGKHAAVLARAVDAWSHGRCQFIGENVGLALTPKRQVDRRKVARELAAHEVFHLHRRDPKAYPVETALFEKVGEWYGLSEGVTRRAYYTERMKALRAEIAHIETQFCRDGKT